MGFRFQKRIKICPGINLNLSKSGIGVSVGPRGAKLSVGPTGTFIHASAVGTGLYYRKKISPNKGRAESTGTRSRKKLVASESDLRELAKQKGFLLAPDPDYDPEKEPCKEPIGHKIFTESGEVCVWCDPNPGPPTCIFCEKPTDPDSAISCWHPSCYWVDENVNVLRFLILALILGGICWFQGISLGLGPFISYFM